MSGGRGEGRERGRRSEGERRSTETIPSTPDPMQLSSPLLSAGEKSSQIPKKMSRFEELRHVISDVVCVMLTEVC